MENERIARIEAARRKKMATRAAVTIATLLVLTGAVAGGVFYSRRSRANLPGMFYPSVGAQHIPFGAEPSAPYNSNPPSSGEHYPGPANWGIYNEEIPDQIFIHNLEHGGIWLAYRPAVSSSTVRALEDIVRSFGSAKWVMAPRFANDADIAVAAWTRVLKFDIQGEISEDQKREIEDFYKAYRNKGPEFVP